MIHPRALAVGEVFVNHRIEGLAGRGGMGVVYRAIDLDLDRTVALKVIAPALAERADFRSRFVAESKAAASIEHQHVIPVYYAGEREGVLFIVMRYVDGPDLRALVRLCGPLDPGRAVRIVAQVGDALDAAHARGLVHRDVKPENVLLGAGDHAYLTDFGLTQRAVSAQAPATRCGWAGTPGYVAPEQILGDEVDARADVYALGCVLVHALTGAQPYVRDSDEATLRAHLKAPPPVDRVPRELAGVVERALAKDPSARFASAGELGRAALAVVRGAERLTPAPRPAAPRRPPLAAPAVAHLGDTHASPPSAVTTRGERWRAAAVGATLLALGALVFGQAGRPGDAVRAGTALADMPPHSAAQPVRVGKHPDAVATAGGRVWVLSSAAGMIYALDAVSGRRQDRVDIGASASGAAMTGGLGAVWAVKASTRSLIRIGAEADHRHLDTAIALAVTGTPDRIAFGENAVWVAARGGAGGEDSIVKVDPRTFAQQRVALPGGTQHIAVGQGAVWVTNAPLRTVTRIDATDLNARMTIAVGAAPRAIAVTRHAVWITTGADRAVLRINPESGQRRRIALERRPTGIAAQGGSVWAMTSAGVVRIDPTTLRVRDTIRTPASPVALARSGDGALWLALWRADSAQRITIRR